MQSELKIKTVLKQLMRTQGETLTSLSLHTGVPKSTISDWMSSRTPNPIQVVKIANYFGVSLHFLLFGSEDPQETIQKIIKEEFFSGTFEINIKRINNTNKK